MDSLSFLPTFESPWSVTWWLLSHGGFILVFITLGYGIWWMYLDHIQGVYASKIKYTLLAVDVPKENEQTPKAVEHIFSHFHGIQKSGNWKEKYIDGYFQSSITLELISIDGYIQYLVRCPTTARDLVEAAIYAQYPNAEITEVEDYTAPFGTSFPNPDFNIWAAEIVLSQPDPYPIRTYPMWEHSLTQTFLDPMASILEIMNRLQTGEQIWLQLILAPTGGSEFRKQGLDLINKLIGAKVKKKVTALDQILQAPAALAIGTWETVTRTLLEPGETSKKKDDSGLINQIQFLPPNQRAIVEGIGIKISKLAFTTKFRVLYLGRNDIFNRARVTGILGALKQFNTLDMNSFRPHKSVKTAAEYYFVERRTNAWRRKLMRAYKERSMSGGRPITLNTEELASLWHFPVITVKAPLVQKTEAKRGEPPVRLPVGDYNPPALEEKAPATPANLPTA